MKSAATIVRRARTQPDSSADPKRAAVADLVSYSFEVDDERVGRDTDGHDQTGDSGERQREPRGLTEDDHGAVDRASRRRPG